MSPGGSANGGSSSGGGAHGGSSGNGAGGTGTSGGGSGQSGGFTSGQSGSGGSANGGNLSGGNSNGNSSGGRSNSGGNSNGNPSGGRMNGAGGTSNGSGGSSNGSGGNFARGGNGSGGNGSGGAMQGAGGSAQCGAPSGGSTGYTTRFWDCCKPSCAWPNNAAGKQPAKTCNQQNQSTSADTASACSGGGGYACWDMAPWAVSDTLAYGYAAFNGSQCGQCYELKFTGQSNSQANDAGSAALSCKTMIVQVVNIGNITQGQFDLMIPGGGVGQFNACTQQWGVSGSALGEQYGGIQLTCQKQNNDWSARKTCTENACNNLFKNSSQSTLLAGCKWGVEWLQAADNPKVVYKQVTCPDALTSKSGLR